MIAVDATSAVRSAAGGRFWFAKVTGAGIQDDGHYMIVDDQYTHGPAVFSVSGMPAKICHGTRQAILRASPGSRRRGPAVPQAARLPDSGREALSPPWQPSAALRRLGRAPGRPALAGCRASQPAQPG